MILEHGCHGMPQAVEGFAYGTLMTEPRPPCPFLHKVHKAASDQRGVNRDRASTVSRLELLHIVCVQLADPIGSRSGIQAEQRNPLAVWLLFFHPLVQPLFLRRGIPASIPLLNVVPMPPSAVVYVQARYLHLFARAATLKYMNELDTG